jgi:hypothetical protein
VISWQIPSAGFVSLKVYDVLGQQIANPNNGRFEEGAHKYEFNAAALNSGVYFYTVDIKGDDGNVYSSSRKMTVIK